MEQQISHVYCYKVNYMCYAYHIYLYINADKLYFGLFRQKEEIDSF